MTPLGAAIYDNHAKIVTLLIIAGADVARALACGAVAAPSEDMLKIIKEAHWIQNDLGGRDWSVARLLETRIFSALKMPMVIEDMILELTTFYGEDAFTNACIDREIARKKTQINRTC